MIVELEMEPSQKLTALTLPGNDVALISTEITLIRLISNITPQQPVVEELLVCKDDITILLFLTTKSTYYSKLITIADQYSVEISPIRDENVLKLRGTKTSSRSQSCH